MEVYWWRLLKEIVFLFFESIKIYNVFFGNKLWVLFIVNIWINISLILVDFVVGGWIMRCLEVK